MKNDVGVLGGFLVYFWECDISGIWATDELKVKRKLFKTEEQSLTLIG